MEQPLWELRAAAGWAFCIGADSYSIRYPSLDHPHHQRLRSAIEHLVSLGLLELVFKSNFRGTGRKVNLSEAAPVLQDGANWLTYRERSPADESYYEVVPTEGAESAYERGMKEVGRTPFGCWPQEWTMGQFETVEAEVQALTAPLRGGADDPDNAFYADLEHRIRERGIDPGSTLLAASEPRGFSKQRGWLVTQDERVIEFILSAETEGDAVLEEWSDVAADWHSFESWCRDRIQVALDLARQR